MKEPLFSRPVLILFSACTVALFALSAILSSRGRLVRADSAGPGAYSISAVGCAGFYDLLRRSDRPAVRSAGDTSSKVGFHGTLVIAEPELRNMSGAGAGKLAAPRLLIVLPKWRVTRDKDKPSWVSKADLLPASAARQTIALVMGGRSEVFREEWPSEWPINDIGFTPKGAGAVQLLSSDKIRTVVGGGNGALVGEIIEGDRRILILSDPDVMSNHGIGRGENAVFMLALIDALRFWNNDDPDAPVVFDETVHGWLETRGSPAGLLFSFPFAVVTVLACCSAALAALAGMGRFGAPRAGMPGLCFGRSHLIDNSARLLDYGGHHAVVLARYVRMTIRLAAQSLHAPAGLDEQAAAEWLDRVGRARGVSRSCSAILRNTTDLGTGERHLLKLIENAREIYLWKGEILIGSSAHR